MAKRYGVGVSLTQQGLGLLQRAEKQQRLE